MPVRWPHAVFVVIQAIVAPSQICFGVAGPDTAANCHCWKRHRRRKRAGSPAAVAQGPHFPQTTAGVAALTRHNDDQNACAPTRIDTGNSRILESMHHLGCFGARFIAEQTDVGGRNASGKRSPCEVLQPLLALHSTLCSIYLLRMRTNYDAVLKFSASAALTH